MSKFIDSDHLNFLTPFEHAKIEEEVLKKFMPLIQPAINEAKEEALRLKRENNEKLQNTTKQL